MAINSNKSVFWWNFILKSVFAIVLIYFFYRQIFHNNDLSESWFHFKNNITTDRLPFLAFCILLMPINWGLESLKWKILVDPFEKISFVRSFQAVLSGISVALLTPNRVGEYGGRMVKVNPQNNWKAVISTLMSSYAQNIWNVGLGLIALLIFLNTTQNLEGYFFSTSLVISSLFISLIIFLYYNIEVTSKLLQRFNKYKIVKKALVHMDVLHKYKSSLLGKVLFLAFLRYIVYLIQYLLILNFFGLSESYVNVALGIATIFLIQTSLPLPPIIGFLARGEIALLVWETYHFNELSVLASSYLLWFLNLIVPSIMGALVILSSNLSRTFGLNRNYFK